MDTLFIPSTKTPALNAFPQTHSHANASQLGSRNSILYTPRRKITRTEYKLR